jgi:hypothetical protein
VRGLRTKSNEFYNKVLNSSYDIICLTETWLNDSFYDSEYFDRSFIVFRKDRDPAASGLSRGGGVAVAVRGALLPELRPELAAPPPADELWVSIPTGQTPVRAAAPQPSHSSRGTYLHIICTYIPHGHNHVNLLASLFNRISDDCDKHPDDTFLILGDFNISNACWIQDADTTGMSIMTNGEYPATLAADFMNLSQLYQFNSVKNMNNRLLDLIFSNKVCDVTSCSRPLTSEDGHHPALNINIILSYEKLLSPNINAVKKMFHLSNFEAIKNKLAEIDWCEEFSNLTGLEAQIEFFYIIINKLIALHVPSKKLCSSSRYPPWFSRPLIKLLTEKRKFHKKWKQYNQQSDYDSFSFLRSRAKDLEKMCYESYIRTVENKIKLNPKYFWTYVKSKQDSSNYPHKFVYKDQSVTDSREICNLFNKYFNSVFVSADNSETIHTNVNPNSHLNINTIKINSDIVFKQLKSVNVNKGAGADGIHPLLIHKCAKELTIPITYIFTQSLVSGTFPGRWKQALITPIPKNNRKDDVSQYRPISKLCIFGKILEKIVADELSFTVRNFLSPNQHGFFKGRCVESNLVTFTDYLLTALNNKCQVDVVYTDFSKAFDKISHRVLLEKLWSAGIHGDLFRWIKSYITNRSQAVSIKGFLSDYLYIPSGVPQGSHLGPLLFTLYINDIGNVVSSSDHLLYADDAKIYKIIKTVDDCCKLQEDINSIAAYCDNNQLFLNPDKCNIITFTRNRNPILHMYSLNNQQLNRVDKIRDLGVIIDNKLTFHDHIDTIVQRAYKQLGFLLRVCKPFQHVMTYMILYYSLVRSILDFACIIWSPFYKCHINRIEQVQKKFLKAIDYRMGRGRNSYSNSLSHYGLLPLEGRRIQFDVMFLYKIVNNLIDSPSLLGRLLFKIPQRTARHKKLFAIPYSRTKYVSYSYFNRCLNYYNTNMSHVDIFSTGYCQSFKTQIICHLKSKL